MKNKDSDEIKFERFGKYLILDHLVDGGMAKICRARFLSEQANKIVAIKMIQPQYSKDPVFQKMFEDELKVTFGLSHPNIAQTYDYGDVDGQLFTAMEYVDGANLKQVLDRLKAAKYAFPVEMAIYIAAQVCQGLHYAHTYKDSLSGKPFNIIHRDISPHNIMITWDGAVKIIDFGIAKADSNTDKTKNGTIKGKVSYIAPEYIEGLDLKPTYDQFALGLTLWELLCGRKVFKAKNELAILKEIQDCKVIPPSRITPRVDKELDDIILKTLSKDPMLRYENMDVLNRELIKYLYSHYPNFNPADLSRFSKDLFKDEIERDRKQLVKYGKIDIKRYLKDFDQEQKSGKKRKLERSVSEFAFDPAGQYEKDLTLTHHAGLSRRSSSSLTQKRNQSKAQTRMINNRTQLTQATTKAIKKKNKKTSKGFKLPYVAMFALLALSFAYRDQIEALLNTAIPERAPATITEANNFKNGSLEEGRVFIDGWEPFMSVYVNGDSQIYSKGVGLRIPIDQLVAIEIRARGKRPIKNMVTLDYAGQEKTIIVKNLEVARDGFLTTSRNYPEGSIIHFDIEGEKISETLPLKNYRLPAGKHRAKIINPQIQSEKTVEFNIEVNKKFFLE